MNAKEVEIANINKWKDVQVAQLNNQARVALGIGTSAMALTMPNTGYLSALNQGAKAFNSNQLTPRSNVGDVRVLS